MSEDCKTVYISILPVGSATVGAVIGQRAREADRRYASRRRQEMAQRRSLLARALLRDLLEHAFGLSGSEWEIGNDARGQPWASHPGLEPPIAVSITHSGEYVAVAATQLGAIGIDIERHDPARRFSDIAATAFGPGFAHIDEAGAFYRLWCLREATGKATGEGLASDLDLEAFTRASPWVGAWRCNLATRTWLLAHLEPAPGYSLAVGVLVSAGATPANWSLDSLSWRRLPDEPT